MDNECKHDGAKKNDQYCTGIMHSGNGRCAGAYLMPSTYDGDVDGCSASISVCACWPMHRPFIFTSEYIFSNVQTLHYKFMCKPSIRLCCILHAF